MVVWSMPWTFLLSPLYLTFSRLLILEVTQIKDKKILLFKLYGQMKLDTFRVAIIIMSTINKCLGGCREKGTLLHCWWKCKLVQPLWRTVETFLMKPLKLSCAVLCLVAQPCPTLWKPMDSSPPGSSVHGDSPSKNTRMGCPALLQEIFSTKFSNPAQRCSNPTPGHISGENHHSKEYMHPNVHSNAI